MVSTASTTRSFSLLAAGSTPGTLQLAMNFLWAIFLRCGSSHYSAWWTGHNSVDHRSSYRQFYHLLPAANSLYLRGASGNSLPVAILLRPIIRVGMLWHGFQYVAFQLLSDFCGFFLIRLLLYMQLLAQLKVRILRLSSHFYPTIWIQSPTRLL